MKNDLETKFLPPCCRALMPLLPEIINPLVRWRKPPGIQKTFSFFDLLCVFVIQLFSLW